MEKDNRVFQNYQMLSGEEQLHGEGKIVQLGKETL